MDLQVNDIAELKKEHPCGSKRWQVLRGGSRKSDRGAGLGLSSGGAAPFSPVSSSTASVKLLPKNSMTKSMGAPPLLWLCLYHL